MNKTKITLVCEECLSRNYSILKSKISVSKLEVKKHCQTCNKHTKHIETR